MGTESPKDAIVQGGALPYNSSKISNHHAIFIDFQLTALLGQHNKIAPEEKRRKLHRKSHTQSKNTRKNYGIKLPNAVYVNAWSP